MATAYLVALICGVADAQATPGRPKITGISHVGYFVSNLPKALVFWHDFLGFDEYKTLPKPDGSVRIAFIKINDRQHIELFNEPVTHVSNFMSHLCFEVDDIEAMRRYLRAKGFDVPPGDAHKTKVGDYAFEIKDPDGMLIEFVQRLPDGVEMKDAGKFAPETRISTKIYHAGFLVGNSVRSLDFYGNVLGFKELWRGGANPKMLSWINMRVPDGTDYVEFMLYDKLPETFGTKNHLSLSVPDVAAAVADLEARPAYAQYKMWVEKPVAMATGVNQKRQVNLFDPDGTRVELMEESTVTGKPTPPSTAPPPAPSHD